MPRPLLTPGKEQVPIVQEVGWVPGPVRTGAENLAHMGFDPRIVQTVAQSLYRLSNPAHNQQTYLFKYMINEIYICVHLFVLLQMFPNAN